MHETDRSDRSTPTEVLRGAANTQPILAPPTLHPLSTPRLVNCVRVEDEPLSLLARHRGDVVLTLDVRVCEPRGWHVIVGVKICVLATRSDPQRMRVRSDLEDNSCAQCVRACVRAGGWAGWRAGGRVGGWVGEHSAKRRLRTLRTSERTGVRACRKC